MMELNETEVLNELSVSPALWGHLKQLLEVGSKLSIGAPELDQDPMQKWTTYLEILESSLAEVSIVYRLDKQYN